MEFKEEPINTLDFKKRFINCAGIDNLQDALNVLRLFQHWRDTSTAKTLDELGIYPSLITAAINYILSKFHANAPIYRCISCKHNKEPFGCDMAAAKCNYERIKDDEI